MIPARLPERRKEETIVVKDPHGHIARLLEVEWVPNAALEVRVRGTRAERRNFRRVLEAVAKGKTV